MSGRGRGRGVLRSVLGPPKPLTFAFDLNALAINEDEFWDEGPVHTPPRTNPPLQPQGVGNPNERDAGSEAAGRTWDKFMYKQAGVTPIGDKMFQSFLNRGNVFGNCKHTETVVSGGRCGCVRKTSLKLCLQCTTLLPCCLPTHAGPHASRY